MLETEPTEERPIENRDPSADRLLPWIQLATAFMLPAILLSMERFQVRDLLV